MGVTVNSATCTSAAPAALCATTVNGNPAPWTLAPAGTSIAAGGTHTYTLTVTFTVVPGSVTANGSDCTLQIDETGTGLLNKATLTPAVGAPVDRTACEPIPQPLTYSFGITKTPSISTVTPGAALAFTVVITNNGPAAADGAIITDPAIPFYTANAVSCLGTTGGATCPTPLTIGALQGAGMTVATFPALATITLRIDGISTLVEGQLVNTVIVSPPVGTPGVAEASATAVVAPKVGVIPTLSLSSLIALMLLLGFTSAFYLRRGKR